LAGDAIGRVARQHPPEHWNRLIGLTPVQQNSRQPDLACGIVRVDAHRLAKRQLGLFLSAVVLPVSEIPEAYRPWAMLNPVIGVIEACRAVVAGRPVDWLAFVASIALSAVVFAIGYLYFRKAERLFADTI